MTFTILTCTARTEPHFDWLADSIANSVLEDPIELEWVVIDAKLWGPDATRRKIQLANAVRGRFETLHLAPKPCRWQGPHRLTKSDYFALNNARNTGLIVARGDRIILLDDCTVVDKFWLRAHVANANYGLAGTYRTYHTATVIDGEVVRGTDGPYGWDARRSIASTFQRTNGGWGFGLNTSFPLAAAIAVNGFDELYDGQGGSEDCFSAGTQILTRDGLQNIGSLVGQTVEVLTKSRRWVKAPIKQFGRRLLWKVVCRDGYRHTKELFCTPDHKWFVKNYHNKAQRNIHVVPTTRLQPGAHYLACVTANNALKTKTIPSPFGIAHGIAFGDGTNDKKASGKVPLYQSKKELGRFFAACSNYATKCDGQVYSGLPNYFKRTPDIRENASYLLGWVMGYFAADGSVSKAGQIQLTSASYANIKFFRDACLVLGLQCFPIREEVGRTAYVKGAVLYRVTLAKHTLTKAFFLRRCHRVNFRPGGLSAFMTTKLNEWQVVSVTPTSRVEPTFCAVVPKTRAFVLEGNILTHNCDFGVRAERSGTIYFWDPECVVYQILDTHEAVFEHVGWNQVQVQRRKPKELVIRRDNQPHFANEVLVERLVLDEPTRFLPLGNNFSLTSARDTWKSGHEFEVGKFEEIDWRDGEKLDSMK